MHVSRKKELGYFWEHYPNLIGFVGNIIRDLME